MKTLGVEVVEQRCSYKPVCNELQERIESLNRQGVAIRSIFETVTNTVDNKQGFIIVYEYDSDEDTATWEDKEVRGSIVPYCSACGNGLDTIYHLSYCPSCGRKMTNPDILGGNA